MNATSWYTCWMRPPAWSSLCVTNWTQSNQNYTPPSRNFGGNNERSYRFRSRFRLLLLLVDPMIYRIQCNKCGSMVKHDTQIVQGCLCDPDSPSWVAIQPDGRMLKMSQANYMVFEQSWFLPSFKRGWGQHGYQVKPWNHSVIQPSFDLCLNE